MNPSTLSTIQQINNLIELRQTVYQSGLRKGQEALSELLDDLWVLFLARPLVAGKHLPWQKPAIHRTPTRVKRVYPTLFSMMGTPRFDAAAT